jgi:hypothetical protein
MGLQLPASRSPDRDSARTVLTREDIVKRLDNGGRVVLASALTGKGYSAKIALTDAQLARLRERYGSLEPWWRDTFGYGFDGLTESEARFILTLKDRPGPDALRARVDAARVRAGSGLDAGNDPDGGDRPSLARLSADEAPRALRSTLAGVEPNDDQNITSYAKLLARVKVGGTDLVALFTVREQRDGQWYYNTVTLADRKCRPPPKRGP